MANGFMTCGRTYHGPPVSGERGADPGQRVEIDALDRSLPNSAFRETCTVYRGPLCPGESLGVAYTAMNGGVIAEWVRHELWFSIDDQPDTSVDVPSPDVYSLYASETPAESSRLQKRYFEVPTGLAPDTEYRPIVRVLRIVPVPGFQERSERNNWIPLRGTIRTEPNGACA